MIKYLVGFICALIGTVVLGLALAYIFDIVFFMTDKLSNWIFGKGGTK